MGDHAGSAGQLVEAADEQQNDEVGTQSSCIDATQEYCPPSEGPTQAYDDDEESELQEKTQVDRAQETDVQEGEEQTVEKKCKRKRLQQAESSNEEDAGDEAEAEAEAAAEVERDGEEIAAERGRGDQGEEDEHDDGLDPNHWTQKTKVWISLVPSIA